jgi:streptomycin 6-kinase
MANMHRASVPSLVQIPTVNQWLATLDKDWSLPIHYLQKARKIKQYLSEKSLQSILLHGDLHHDNILAHKKGWVVIDPKGVIGEEVFDVAAFIRNPFPDLLLMSNVQNILYNRIHQFSKHLNMDPVRLYYWSYVYAILSTIWALEDGLDPENFIRFIEILDCSEYTNVFL